MDLLTKFKGNILECVSAAIAFLLYRRLRGIISVIYCTKVVIYSHSTHFTSVILFDITFFYMFRLLGSGRLRLDKRKAARGCRAAEVIQVDF